MNAYLMFVLAKEAGRAASAPRSTACSPPNAAADVALHRRIITILTAQDTYLSNFRSMAPQGLDRGRCRRCSTATPAARPHAMRQAALDRMDQGTFGVEPANWFTTITRKIDLLKVEEDRFASDADGSRPHC